MQTKLYVGNLPFSCTALELQGLFSEAGAVAAIDLVFDKVTGRPRGFAFVTMASSVSAPARNRTEFESLLKRALGIDVNKRPELRLANLVAQKRARFLLSRAGSMFR